MSLSNDSEDGNSGGEHLPGRYQPVTLTGLADEVQETLLLNDNKPAVLAEDTGQGEHSKDQKSSTLSIPNPSEEPPPQKYYSRAANLERSRESGRTRTLSDTRVQQSLHRNITLQGSGDDESSKQGDNEGANKSPPRPTIISRVRRFSHAEKAIKPRRFLIDVEDTQRLILEQEDTDGDYQITVNDVGPRVVGIGTANSNAFKKYDIRGTALISNLLQELTLAKEYGRKYIILDESRLTEAPIDRVSRMIRTMFWSGLTRRIDDAGLAIICADPKNRLGDRNPRLYVPYRDREQYDHYSRYAKEHPEVNLDVQGLPKIITAEYVRDLAERPGLLTLAVRYEEDPSGRRVLKAIPFVVPGARFNELYAWDSYFIGLGLIADAKVDMVRGMVDHFVYEIRHYGKILNGSRSYYLLRSQPPFLTDMALLCYEHSEKTQEDRKWLATALRAAIKEYEMVWTAEPRLDPETGLSRYRPEGLGIPSETEASHFTHILRPYAEKHGMSVNDFSHAYNYQQVHEPELEEYFLHDRAVRESGHDTSYRLERRCANLATIDLNALLYKYEMDLARSIQELFNNQLIIPTDELADVDVATSPQENIVPDGIDVEKFESSDKWFKRAAQRRERIDKYLWNEKHSLYYDYDTVKKCQSRYESVTAFYALWAGCANEKQAEAMVKNSLTKFEVKGGLVCGTEDSRGPISLSRPNRQWDYPYGWAPHQILAWRGLSSYGYVGAARRICYRWLHLCTLSVVDRNGVVPEKYDVVNMTTNVDAEYGNQGTDFRYVPREGFGWCNASIQVGLQYMTLRDRRGLGTLTDPDTLFKKYPEDFGVWARPII